MKKEGRLFFFFILKISHSKGLLTKEKMSLKSLQFIIFIHILIQTLQFFIDHLTVLFSSSV